MLTDMLHIYFNHFIFPVHLKHFWLQSKNNYFAKIIYENDILISMDFRWKKKKTFYLKKNKNFSLKKSFFK